METIKIDLGFGREEWLEIPLNSSYEEIKNLTKVEFGEPLFRIIYRAPIELVSHNEY